MLDHVPLYPSSPSIKTLPIGKADLWIGFGSSWGQADVRLYSIHDTKRHVSIGGWVTYIQHTHIA